MAAALAAKTAVCPISKSTLLCLVSINKEKPCSAAMPGRDEVFSHNTVKRMATSRGENKHMYYSTNNENEKERKTRYFCVNSGVNLYGKPLQNHGEYAIM